MSVSLIVQILSAFFSLLIALIVLRNLKRNPYLNIFIFLIFITNLIRIPFSLTYALGWQTQFPEIPKPFNSLLICNSVFFYWYIRSLLVKGKTSLMGFWIALVVPFLLLVVNLFFRVYPTDKFILKGFSFQIAVIFILYFLYHSYKVVYRVFWVDSRKLFRFSNFKLIRFWVFILVGMYTIGSIRIIIIFSFELIYNKEAIAVGYPYASSIFYLVMLVILFLHPEILYGLQRERISIPILNVTSTENPMLPTFVWRTQPKAIHNKLDLALAIKFHERMAEITRKLESKVALQAIVKDPNINAIVLAEKLDIPRTYIHFLFKYHSDISFVQYRSKIRVHYAIEKMKEDFLSKNTMDALARECGFASYNPFYSAFKSEMGIGPREVLAELKQGLNQYQ
jgi:AraC-like DNA-binding protein